MIELICFARSALAIPIRLMQKRAAANNVFVLVFISQQFITINADRIQAEMMYDATFILA